MKQCNHSTTSNTDEVFRTFIGCALKGLLHKRNTSGGYYTVLVFECGWGLAINDNGSHWVESPEDVQRAVREHKRNLDHNKQELEHILRLAGETA